MHVRFLTLGEHGKQEVRNLGRNRRFLAIFFGYFLVCYKKVTRKNVDALCMEFYSGSVWCKLFLSWDNDFVQRDPQRVCLHKFAVRGGRTIGDAEVSAPTPPLLGFRRSGACKNLERKIRRSLKCIGKREISANFTVVCMSNVSARGAEAILANFMGFCKTLN